MSGRGDQQIITNRRARHDYALSDHVEAGIMLVGCEVKSVRAGHANLQESYVRIESGEAWLYGMHIKPYEFSRDEVDPLRKRKLLLHHKQLLEFERATADRGITIIPTKVYFSNGRAKVEIAVGKGRRSYDKRQELAKRSAQRDIDRARKHLRD